MPNVEKEPEKVSREAVPSQDAAPGRHDPADTSLTSAPFLGLVKKEPGWTYQAVMRDNLDNYIYPKTLRAKDGSAVEAPGWEIVRRDANHRMGRGRADSGSSLDSMATQGRLVWIRIPDAAAAIYNAQVENRANRIEQRMKSGTTERPNSVATIQSKVNDGDEVPKFATD